MSSIFGIYRKDNIDISMDVANKMKDSLSYWNPDRSGLWVKHNIYLGCHSLFQTPESPEENLPYFTNEYCITSDSRIDYRKELMNNLEESWDTLGYLPDSQLILKAYIKWGVR